MSQCEPHLEILRNRIADLEKTILSIAMAPTESERSARLEVAHAEIENRLPNHWAQEYIEYISTKEDHYF